MMRFSRPAEPPGFAKRAKDIRATIAAMLLAGKAPASSDFKNVWGRFKDTLVTAQHGRCGYCDALVAHIGYGDVEHFRPKSAVQEVSDSDALGACARDEAPTVKTFSHTGYALLAYDWNNYLFSCERCNQQYKRCLFPLATRSSAAPSDGQGEVPLLLHCYGPDEPADHLEFDEIGFVKPVQGSQHGYETIVTVGLGRSTLILARRDKTERIHLMVRRLNDKMKAGGDWVGVLRDLVIECDAARPFGGVARAIVQQQLRLTWPEVEALAAPNAAQTP